MFEHKKTLRDRLEHAVSRTLLRLPASIMLRLSGQPRIQLDGEQLEPDIQLFLKLHARWSAPLNSSTPEAVRRRTHHEALVHRGPEIRIGAVKEVTVAGGAGPLRALHYLPERPGHAPPLLVYFHGGGYVLGDLVTHDSACRLLVKHSGAQVLSVEYRLAPEHRFPAAIEDAAAAFRWAAEHAAELGADPRRVAIGGDSAGGNLAVVVTQVMKSSGGPRPWAQVLIYPKVERTVRRPSLDLFAQGFFLTGDDIAWFQKNYLEGTGASLADPRISPLLSPDLSGLPPALVVTAAFDPLRDEGEEYARALQKAGVPVKFRRLPGMVHGFINLVGVSPSALSTMIEVSRLAGEFFATTSAPGSSVTANEGEGTREHARG